MYAVRCMQGYQYTTELGGRTLTLETGKMAKFASGAVKLTYGETVLLATVVAKSEPTVMDFLPLTVEFEERLYAVGKIPGSFARREGRPGEKAILAARITDRQIRPLFPKGYRHETQVVITVLSADQENMPDVLAPIAVSSALMLSDIPWMGPCACVRVGYIDGAYRMNPTATDLGHSQIDIVVAATQDAVLMVEAGAFEVSEELLVGAIEFAHREMQPLFELQHSMQAERGKEKWFFDVPERDLDFEEEVSRMARTQGLREVLLTQGKKARGLATEGLKDNILSEMLPADGDLGLAGKVASAFDRAVKAELRRMILEENLRTDGRNSETVRPIWIETSCLPKVHGSALFTRGETQVLGVTTLGAGRDEVEIDDLSQETTDRFMLHYNFPPYSTGEVKRMGGQSRREIGHGALAKRALRAVLPPFEAFPYVLRVVGEVLESNGSSSMATVCAGCLSLMDAGVPISAPVAGVAMGLIMGEAAEGQSAPYTILTDILGSEDALGDMDFKVCGTEKGVTALQMDIKISGITPKIMREALDQARRGRMHILAKMQEALPEIRSELSDNAPRILTLKINPEKIGVVIGPGGKNIRELEAMGATVNIEQDGTVRIFSSDAEKARSVFDRVEQQTREPKMGEVYDGTIVRIMPYGAFVKLFGDVDGMLHISQMAEQRLEKVEDLFKVGDSVRVKIAHIDEKGKFNLVRPELEGKHAKVARPNKD